MTTVAGPHHHLRAAPILNGGAFALATIGLLLTVSLLVGGPSPVSGVASSAGPRPVHIVTATRHAVAPSTIPTTTPVLAVATPPASAAPAPVTVATVPPADPAPAFTTGCADALSFLSSHQAPGFVDTCAPGSALGHSGYTCATVPGRCDGVRIVHIACPAPFVFMNEAHNSWTVIGQGSGIDPYGQGNAAEQAACNRYR
jgi:hypothetical protein